MAAAFQGNAFQITAFQVGTAVASTVLLQLPVDYYMERLPQFRECGRTFEPGRGRGGETVRMSAGPRGRIAGPAPSFTVKSTKRGYE